MAQPWDYIAKVVSLGDSGCGKSSLTIRLCEGRFSPHHDVTIGVEFGSRIVPVGPPASDALHINRPSKHASPTSPTLPPSPPSLSKQQQKHMKLSLWDTAGQETYKSITRSYFRGASGALLVFDITRRATFVAATSWLGDLRQIAEDGIVVVLVGNKSDLTDVDDGGGGGGGGGGSAQGGGSSGFQGSTNTQRGHDPSVSAGPSASTEKGPGATRQVTAAEAEEWCRANGVMQYVETSAKSGAGVERAFLEVAERIYQNIEAGKYDLNDRRSGVKVPGAGGGASLGGMSVTGGGGDRVRLGDAARRGGAGGRACC